MSKRERRVDKRLEIRDENHLSKRVRKVEVVKDWK